jgi:hypothetical protein
MQNAAAIRWPISQWLLRMLATMREQGVRSVDAFCGATDCGHFIYGHPMRLPVRCSPGPPTSVSDCDVPSAESVHLHAVELVEDASTRHQPRPIRRYSGAHEVKTSPPEE